MSHGTEHHLEHAEHAQHPPHDPFDRRVAMTMTIMAAMLAGATLLSHNAHTETLRLATSADTFHTQAADQWSFYQAKNIRSHEYQAFLLMEQLLSKDGVRQDNEAKANTRVRATGRSSVSRSAKGSAPATRKAMANWRP